MKILQVIPRFNPKHGGGVDVVYNISKYLARLGHNVTILTTDYQFNNDFANTIRKEGVEVLPFKHLFNYCLFIPSPSIEDWISKNIQEFDIIHLNGSRSYQNNVVCKYAIKHNIPYIMQAHGSILKIVSRKSIKLLYDWVWGYNIINHLSKCIALSESEKESYCIAGIPENKIEIIPNGVDLEKFNTFPKQGLFRAKYNLTEEKIIIYLGRLHKSKGIDILPSTLLKLLEKINNVKLVFVGPDDGYADEIKKTIKSYNLNNNVLFTGLVSEEEKVMALIDGDVFITPQFYGFPISFLESWACGLPVVTTNNGDSIPWINENVGYVTNFDSSELAEALFNILNDPDKKEKFGNNAKILVQNELNWKVIVKQIEAFYESCI